ncbi:MAG TPA: HAMP domain-containing sensor histidine kinase, partial [Cyclobacteriaceae bacterium]|nr:HAMP domain-containing sensor histidine kinase [Cyclobacteriaceae bacterium]
ITADFIAYEQTLLNERNASLEQRYLINDVIRFSSFALIGIISMAALVTINNKEKDNRRLLIELQQFNLQLEEKVKERTRELQAANANLVQLNAEKNHFLGITTHDLKAPLAGINGLLEVMKLDKASLSSKHLEYIQLMEETCSNMQRLITDLLDLSRIEQGTTYINPQEVSIIKIFSQMEDRFRPWASKKNIALNFHYPQTAEVIKVDKDILIRILDNLISNAIKFSPRNKEVNVSATTNGNHFHIDIQDEGPGILHDEKVKLFLRFQRLHARPTDGESSSGLGLSIVKDLVGLLQGTIEVNSEEGHGALFKITLPVR